MQHPLMLPALLLAVEALGIVPAELSLGKTELYAALRANQPP